MWKEYLRLRLVRDEATSGYDSAIGSRSCVYSGRDLVHGQRPLFSSSPLFLSFEEENSSVAASLAKLQTSRQQSPAIQGLLSACLSVSRR